MSGHKNNYNFIVWLIWNGTGHLKPFIKQDR